MRRICRCDGMADVTDSKSVGGNTVWVQVPPPAPRRNGLCSIQKAQPVGWAFLIPLRPSSFSAKSPAYSDAWLQAPSRRCHAFAGYQARPFQCNPTALPTRQRAGAESYSRLFPLPRICARIPAGLNGLSFPNKKAPGRVPYLYDPGTAGECIFVRGEIYMLGGSQALLRAEGQQACTAIGTGSGQKGCMFC